MKNKIKTFGVLISLIFLTANLFGQRLKKIGSIPLDSTKENRIDVFSGGVILGTYSKKEGRVKSSKIVSLEGNFISELPKNEGLFKLNGKKYLLKAVKVVDEKEKLGIQDLSGKTLIKCKYDKLDYKSNDLFLGTLGSDRFLVGFNNFVKKIPEEVSGHFTIKSKEIIKSMESKKLMDLEGNELSGIHDYFGYDTLYPNFYIAPKYGIKNLYHLGDSLLLEGYKDGHIRLADKYIFKIHRKNENLSKVYDLNLNEVKPELSFSSVTDLGFKTFKQYRNGRTYGLLGFDMNEILPTIYSNVSVNKDSTIITTDASGNTRLINRKGEEIIKPGKKGVSKIGGGYKLTKENRWSYWCDSNGIEKSPVHFKKMPMEASIFAKYIEGFSPLALPVQDWKRNQYLITPEGSQEKIDFKKVDFISEEIFEVMDSSRKTAIIDYKGNFLTDFEYESLTRMRIYGKFPYEYNKLVIGKKTDKYVILDLKGKILLEINSGKYEVYALNEKIIWSMHSGKWEIYEFEE